MILLLLRFWGLRLISITIMAVCPFMWRLRLLLWNLRHWIIIWIECTWLSIWTWVIQHRHRYRHNWLWLQLMLRRIRIFMWRRLHKLMLIVLRHHLLLRWVLEIEWLNTLLWALTKSGQRHHKRRGQRYFFRNAGLSGSRFLICWSWHLYFLIRI